MLKRFVESSANHFGNANMLIGDANLKADAVEVNWPVTMTDCEGFTNTTPTPSDAGESLSEVVRIRRHFFGADIVPPWSELSRMARVRSGLLGQIVGFAQVGREIIEFDAWWIERLNQFPLSVTNDAARCRVRMIVVVWKMPADWT